MFSSSGKEAKPLALARHLFPAGHHYTMYQVISDSKNNLWMAEFSEGYLGTIDAKTHAVKWFALPTPHARARRMEIDDQDRIVVTEYRGNKVAVFDTKAEKFTEYPLPPYTFPYRANFDKNGAIWASTMSTDRVVRMDPKTGATEQYLMPSETICGRSTSITRRRRCRSGSARTMPTPW